MLRRLLALSLALALLGCAGATAPIRAAASRGDVARALRLYHAYVDDRGYADPGALSEVACAVLRACAASDDAGVRGATFAALQGLGPLARPTLDALARSEGATGDRAAALLDALDGRAGPTPPRLREALRSDDVERRVAAVGALRGRAALRRLAALAREGEARVRVAAVTSLGAHGEAAVDALRAALSDNDPRVQHAAPAALMAASPRAAREALGPLVAAAPTALSIEAARVLATRDDPRGAAHLLATLARASGELRAQAASAAAALPASQGAALAPFMTDRDAEVALRVASILVRREAHRRAAVAALRGLVARADAGRALSASVALATTGDAVAQRAVSEALWSRDGAARRAAASAWPRIVGAEASGVDSLALLLTDADRALAAVAAAGVIAIAAR